MRAPSPPFVLSEAEQPPQQSYGVLQAMSGPAPPSPITTSSSSLSSRQKRTRRHSSRHARRSRSHGHRSRRRTDKRRRHHSNSSNSNTSATASSRSSSASSSQVSTRHLSLRKDSAQQQQRHRSSHGHHHSHHRRHHRRSSSTSRSSSRHRHHRSRKEALLHAERYNYGEVDGEIDGGNGVLPLDITSANLSYTSELNVATTTGEAVVHHLDPVEKDIPLSDWVCGVCSNLNSMQRSACYRCAVSYAESQRAKPCEEIVLVPVPAEKTEMTVAQVVARVTSQGGGNATPAGGVATSQGKTGGNPVEGMIIAQYYDAKQKALYLRFVSIAEATRALVFCRCQLTLSDESDCSTHRDGNNSGEGVHASDAPVLPLSCRMTFSRANKTTRVDTAGLSRREMRQAMNAVLDQPKVKSSSKDDSSLPRELRAQNWQPPASFASAAEEKAYLTLLSDHWAQLSAAQREYYEVRVKQSLTSKASDSQAHTNSGNSKDTTTYTTINTAATTGMVSTGSMSAVESLRRRMEEKKNALKKAAEAAASTATSSSDSSTPVAAPTSNSLALLKQRLAEKKAKLAGDSAATATTTNNDTTTSASSTIATLAVAMNNDDNNREATSAQTEMGDDTAEPVTLYDNFPLPPRYVGWAARADATPPRLEQTWHIPLAIAQRVLPPTLLKQPQPRLNIYSRGH